MKKLFNRKGITLISLVITIIILIIISTIVISIGIRENGILNKSKYAKEEYLNIQENEKEQINSLYSQMLISTNEHSKITMNIEELNKIIDEKVNEKINGLISKQLKYEEKYKFTSTEISQGATNKNYIVEEDGIYYVEIYAETGNTVSNMQVLIHYNGNNISGNYDREGGTHATASANAIISAKKGEYILGYFYSSEKVTTDGTFNYKIIKIQ